MKKYVKQATPFVVPTDDDKVIREHFGMASTGDKSVSVAHMIAPPGWREPHQQPEFDEITFMIRYSNPFEEEAEYIAICLPAFDPKKVHRE